MAGHEQTCMKSKEDAVIPLKNREFPCKEVVYMILINSYTCKASI